MVCAKLLIFNQRSEAGFVWLAEDKNGFFGVLELGTDLQKKKKSSGSAFN